MLPKVYINFFLNQTFFFQIKTSIPNLLQISAKITIFMTKSEDESNLEFPIYDTNINN